MNNNIVRMTIVDPIDHSRNSVKNLLLGIDWVWLEAECSRYEYFTEIVQQTSPAVALVSLDADPQRGLATVAEVTMAVPGCAVMVVSKSQEGSLILQAMRNGAKEFLSAPLKLDDFMAALDRMYQITGGTKEGKTKTNKVITLLGASGGVGCTALAVNLGCVLAENPEHSVAIIDLDLALGDADVWLDIIPEYTIQDVADNITRLDYSMLKRSLTQHASKAFLLPRPVHLESRPPMTPEQLQRVVALLKATFTHLIIDVSKSFTALDVGAMEVSDDIYVVTQLDLPCLRNVVRMNTFLEEQELGKKVRVVVNRAGMGEAQISLNKALETIGREVFGQIPNEYQTVIESRNNGVPFVMEHPKAKISRAVHQLATKIATGSAASEPEAVAEKPKKSNSIFSFLSK